MSLYVARDGRSEGPLTEAEVAGRLRTGAFAGGDLAWREGMADWVALRTLFPVGKENPVFPQSSPSPFHEVPSPFSQQGASIPAPAPAGPSAVSLPKPPPGKVPGGIPVIQPRPAGVSFGARAFPGPEAGSAPAPVPAPIPVPAEASPLDALREELRREKEKVAALEAKAAALEERVRRAAALLSGHEAAGL
jgi:hypothetical protein